MPRRQRARPAPRSSAAGVGPVRRPRGLHGTARRLDPEETREFQSGYFERAREVVELYGGTVEKFIGDAVMAVWGAPTSNEDDAERARAPPSTW